MSPSCGSGQRLRHRVAGVSLVEMMSALLILGIVTSAAFSLYWTGNQAHRRSRFYSQAQTDARTALREMTRVIRSSIAVVSTGTQGTLSGLASGSNQLVLRVPQSSGSPIEVRYYVSNGVLYVQRSTDAAPGSALMRGVTGLTFGYVRTLAGTRTPVDSAPATATEVDVRLHVRRASVTTGLSAYVAIRTAVSGG